MVELRVDAGNGYKQRIWLILPADSTTRKKTFRLWRKSPTGIVELAILYSTRTNKARADAILTPHILRHALLFALEKAAWCGVLFLERRRKSWWLLV